MIIWQNVINQNVYPQVMTNKKKNKLSAMKRLALKVAPRKQKQEKTEA